MFKLTVTVLLALLQMIVSQDLSKQDICSQPESSGFCRALFERYFFDKTSGECKKFIYGGCGGNQNRFDTIDECKKICEVSNQSKCIQKVDVGPCRAQIPRYFYNIDTKNCEMFLFGGCNPNENNFENYETCIKTCF